MVSYMDDQDTEIVYGITLRSVITAVNCTRICTSTWFIIPS